MSMYFETVKQGAALTRRSSAANPMELLAKLCSNDTEASADVIFKKWRKLLDQNKEMMETALLHAFRNYWTALEKTKKYPPLSFKEQMEVRTQREKQAAQLSDHIKNVILMDVELPNGKKLRDATFRDCKNAGGWFTRVSRLGKPAEVVGSKLTEDRLRQIPRS